jgi:hypothetical protein
VPNADSEERSGEDIHSYLETGVIETLVAKDNGLCVGRGSRHLID